MRYLYELGYYLSAGVTALLLGVFLCLLQPRNAYADDPGPNDPACPNQGEKRKCDTGMCWTSATCNEMNICKKNSLCTNCQCRWYSWGDPINAKICECQIPALPE